MSNASIVLVLMLMTVSGFSQNRQTPFNQPPGWAAETIWYQIFVERFRNGDNTNDPKPENVQIPPLKIFAPQGWAISPWTADWFEKEAWAKKLNGSFNEISQYRRYGGDLQGVLDKLDYLQDLGITALFINPLNDAPSLHKYDARHYHHIDVNFGPSPAADNKVIAAEDPANPATWQWTEADKLFLRLVEEVHKRNMKIIMDYSWNHVGTTFWAWEDVLSKQQASVYKDWFAIKTFDNPATTANEFSYEGWLGIPALPEIKKVNVTTIRKAGYPYEGDLAPAPKQHVFDVAKRWLAPNGDRSKGIDGFRLDVSDQIGLVFWRDFRKHVRAIQPDAYLVGEIWWQEWPEKLMNPVPYTQGDVFDAVMFYQVYRPARYFFAKTDFEINAAQFKDSLTFQWNRLTKGSRYAQMNVSSSHDAPRLLTDFYNRNKYKYKASPNEDPGYKTGKPDDETYRRLRLYLIHLFTSVGAPHIWNGEEMGMWGADDPHPRKPLMWKEFNFEPEARNNVQPGPREFDSVKFNREHFSFYRKLIKIRKANEVLSSGEIEFVKAEGKLLVYRRFNGREEIIVAFNLDPIPQSVQLPKSATYSDLLSDGKKVSNRITLDPLKAAILKKIK